MCGCVWEGVWLRWSYFRVKTISAWFSSLTLWVCVSACVRTTRMRNHPFSIIGFFWFRWFGFLFVFFARFSSNCFYLSKFVFSTWNSIRFIWNIKWANQSTNQEKQTTQTNNKSLIAILSGFPLNTTLNSLCCLRLLWNEKGNDKIGRAALVSFASKYHVNQTSYIYVASVDRAYTYKSIKNSCIFLTRFFLSFLLSWSFQYFKSLFMNY